jgi:hypothetical protein
VTKADQDKCIAALTAHARNRWTWTQDPGAIGGGISGWVDGVEHVRACRAAFSDRLRVHLRQAVGWQALPPAQARFVGRGWHGKFAEALISALAATS